MEIKTSIRTYNGKPIRAVYDDKTNSWFYAAVDLIGVLTSSKNPRSYWPVFKKRNPEILTYCKQLKLKALDGKRYMTDILDQEGIDQLLLLLPSRSNESLKKWIKGLGDPLDEQSKNKAYELYDNGLLRDIEVGNTRGLQQIHAYIFGGLYDFAGKIRTRNIMKDNFVFCDVRYLNSTLKKIDRMSEDSLKQIVDKYIEMNIAHPFMEGNGRATRIWLDQILKKNLKKCVDWSKIDKKDYLNAMKRSPLNSKAIYQLIESALTGKINDRQIFMKGIDYSYYYEELD